MTTILVTGAAGFIGFAVARALADDPETNVVAVDDFSRGKHDAPYAELCRRPNVAGLELDLADATAMAQLPAEVDLVYHFAAINGTQNFYEDPWGVARACTLPTFFLLEKYRASPRLQRFVHASTPEIYASTVSRFGWKIPTEESVPLCIDDVENARWSYAGGKLVSEIAVINALRDQGARYTILRYHNVYGPRMGDRHVVPDFLLRMKQGEHRLYGYEETRSFLYIDDCVRATVQLARARAAAGQVVNVGGDREITMLELAKIMLALGGRDVEPTCEPAPRGSVARRAADTTKLRHLIDFSERWSLEAGLRETMRYYLGPDWPELVTECEPRTKRSR